MVVVVDVHRRLVAILALLLGVDHRAEMGDRRSLHVGGLPTARCDRSNFIAQVLGELFLLAWSAIGGTCSLCSSRDTGLLDTLIRVVVLDVLKSGEGLHILLQEVQWAPQIAARYVRFEAGVASIDLLSD